MWKKVKIVSVISLMVCLFAVNANAQTKLTIKLADGAFEKFSWNEAIDLYSYVHEKEPDNIYVIRKLADCYRNMGNTEKVEFFLSKLVDMNQAYPEDFFHYAMALKANGKYEDSEKYLKEYSEMRPEDGRIKMEQSLLEYITFLQQDSSRYKVEHLPFNTKGADWGPVMYDKKLVYVSTGDPELSRELKYNWDNLPFLDLYSVDVDEYGNFSKPSVFAKNLMTSYHEGPATFDKKLKRMYFNSNRNSKNTSSKGAENNLQIYYADYENGQWVYKGEFKYNNRNYNLRHPSLNSTGDILYFSSDMPGGKGGNDIWWCKFDQGEWSAPINLEEVNSEGEELFPFIADDGILYFSSNGQGGMGELDIYMALPDRGVFSSIENLGYPVNTSRDDFGIYLDEVGMSGYFSSNRAGGLGYDDIYKLEILSIPVQIWGTIKDRINTYEISGAKIALIDENNDTIETAYSKEDGEFLFKAIKQRNYRLVVTKDGYVQAEKEVSTFNKLPNQKIELEIFIEMSFDLMENTDELEPLSLESENGNELQIIQIEHINYAYDSDKILPEAALVLNKVIDMVKQYPDLEIKVESHTDSKGSNEYNLKLSKQRARSAFDYLVKNGIDPLTIEYNGYGETQLLNHCEDGVECNEEEHSLNRRSIIKVIRRGKYKTNRNARSIFYF
jgi:outer membrane protein OmpA-like peptidoglycan-associated protein